MAKVPFEWTLEHIVLFSVHLGKRKKIKGLAG
jgi:hypothetical protein